MSNGHPCPPFLDSRNTGPYRHCMGNRLSKIYTRTGDEVNGDELNGDELNGEELGHA